MKNIIIFLSVTVLVWIFPARWGAQFLFPEAYAQFGSQIPWIMAWGGFMALSAIAVALFLSHDD